MHPSPVVLISRSLYSNFARVLLYNIAERQIEIGRERERERKKGAVLARVGIRVSVYVCDCSRLCLCVYV